ncbi:MAG: DUF262 domain-containing protein [Undibacterium sp.]|nr:DUF262 domain-containing protein [Undibacterium sp.]
MSTLDSRINYKQLLDRHGRIRVPIIQRDYAQGRPEEAEVRDDFLQAIQVALNKPADDPSLPFNLDFIYGSVEGGEETRFLPLDGQQRLTTLFLLHWYLAWKDNKWEVFSSMFRANGKSRFSYSVRPSSNEFFDAFVSFKAEDMPADVIQLSALITDQPWYFRSWRLDPTIQSVLFMLDAIHVRFASSSNLFERLISEKQPAITFELLDLKDFGLSDDLYIKMNSRGKPLTPFETFKARYERELKEQFSGISLDVADTNSTVAEYFSWRMDNAWADLFWGARDNVSNQYDGAIMNVFRAVALITRDTNSDRIVEDIDRLRTIVRAPNYGDFHARSWLNEDFTLSLIRLLDAWSDGSSGLRTHLPDGRHFNERAQFQRIVSAQRPLSHTEIVQFAAYVLFLKFNSGKNDSGQFRNWMRVVFNLSENTEYNRTEDLQRSMSGLKDLLPQSLTILDYFADVNSTASGFSKHQIEEEMLKAQLIRAKDSWGDIIDRAEAHGYFRGQIAFLLDYCGITSEAPINDWDNEQHRIYQGKFVEYFGKASVMFDERGLKELPDFRWERALLCLGNYLLPKSRNQSLLVNSIGDQASWKRLLRDPCKAREVVKNLFDRIDVSMDLPKQMDGIIESASGLEPWVEALVKTPLAIAYCQSRCLRFDPSGQIYLLSKTQMNGMHAELFTYALYFALRVDMAKYAPLEFMYYADVSDADTEPRFYISCTKNDLPLRFSVRFDKGRYVVGYEDQGAEIQENVANVLRALEFLAGETRQEWRVDPKGIESYLMKLVAFIANDSGREPAHA